MFNVLVESKHTPKLERHIHTIVDCLEEKRDTLNDAWFKTDKGSKSHARITFKLKQVEDALAAAKLVESEE